MDFLFTCKFIAFIYECYKFLTTPLDNTAKFHKNHKKMPVKEKSIYTGPHLIKTLQLLK